MHTMSASWRLDSGFVYAILRVHAHDFDLDFDFDFDFDFEFEFEFEISLFAFQKRSRRVFLFFVVSRFRFFEIGKFSLSFPSPSLI